MKNTSNFIVVPHGIPSSRRWAIRDTRTGFIVESGFSSSHAAWEYIWREYEPA